SWTFRCFPLSEWTANCAFQRSERLVVIEDCIDAITLRALECCARVRDVDQVDCAAAVAVLRELQLEPSLRRVLCLKRSRLLRCRQRQIGGSDVCGESELSCAHVEARIVARRMSFLHSLLTCESIEERKRKRSGDRLRRILKVERELPVVAAEL